MAYVMIQLDMPSSQHTRRPGRKLRRLYLVLGRSPGFPRNSCRRSRVLRCFRHSAPGGCPLFDHGAVVRGPADKVPRRRGRVRPGRRHQHELCVIRLPGNTQRIRRTPRHSPGGTRVPAVCGGGVCGTARGDTEDRCGLRELKGMNCYFRCPTAVPSASASAVRPCSGCFGDSVDLPRQNLGKLACCHHSVLVLPAGTLASRVCLVPPLTIAP
jgi:hypothetical protein